MCKHEGTEGFRYCPYCGKKIISTTEQAMRNFRKTQRDYCNGFYHPQLGGTIWELACDVYAAEIRDRLTIFNCPEDAADRVLEISKEIEKDIIPAYAKHAPDDCFLTRSKEGYVQYRPYVIKEQHVLHRPYEMKE